MVDGGDGLVEAARVTGTGPAKSAAMAGEEARIGDRRRSYRVSVPEARARCASDAFVETYAIQDLSMGGALLRGPHPLSPGVHLEVALCLPSGRIASAKGRVVRAEDAEDGVASVAIAFDALDADAEDAVEDLVALALASERAPIAVVADSSPTESRALARTLRAIGYHVLRASTPLEVIHCLEYSPGRVDTVLLGINLGRCQGVEFASFLAEAYPVVRRVLVARKSWRARTAAAGVVHRVLSKPWTEELLRAALLRGAEDVTDA